MDSQNIINGNTAVEGCMTLRTEGLVKQYGKRTVVNNVSINVKQGEIVGLLGPNGAGKTTSFYMTTGLIVPNAGRIYLDDKDITSYPVYKRARAGIGYLPQEASVFRKLSVEDNILAVLELTGKLYPNNAKEGISWKSSNAKIATVTDGVVAFAGKTALAALALKQSLRQSDACRYAVQLLLLLRYAVVFFDVVEIFLRFDWLLSHNQAASQKNIKYGTN